MRIVVFCFQFERMPLHRRSDDIYVLLGAMLRIRYVCHGICVRNKWQISSIHFWKRNTVWHVHESMGIYGIENPARRRKSNIETRFNGKQSQEMIIHFCRFNSIYFSWIFLRHLKAEKQAYVCIWIWFTLVASIYQCPTRTCSKILIDWSDT